MFSGVRLGKWWLQFMLSLGCQPAHSLLSPLCGFTWLQCAAARESGRDLAAGKRMDLFLNHVSLLERMKYLLCNVEQGKRKQI